MLKTPQKLDEIIWTFRNGLMEGASLIWVDDTTNFIIGDNYPNV